MVVGHLPQRLFIGFGEILLHRPVEQVQLFTEQRPAVRGHDARIVTICQQHGVSELWSADRDFGRFVGLTVRNPLVG